MKVVTYLINLDGSDKRLSRAISQLEAVNWPYERFSAYDGRGKQLSEFKNYDDQLAQNLLGRSLLNSELGCYLSHQGCVEKFLATDADYLVVLEDDMEIKDSFAVQLKFLLDYLDQQKDLEWYLINIAAKKKKIAKDIQIFENFSLWHAYYFPIRGLGLIWSRKGAEAFLEQSKTMMMPVDILFQRWLSKNGKGLAVWPAFVKPAGLDSEILGTVSAQGIARKEKENRSNSHGWKKQKRMWEDRFYAVKHWISGT